MRADDISLPSDEHWAAILRDPEASHEAVERMIQTATRTAANTVVDNLLGIPNESDEGLRAMLVDWSQFWQVDHNDAEWIAEPVIAAKRSTALFAPGGTGKSLLSLYLAAKLATGADPFAKRKTDPINVLYLDYEMTDADLAERLENMGFGSGTDLSRLHYALLPSLPGLDQPEGGKAVVRLAQLCDADLVVIDTFGRAVHGDENDADTVRAWYRWTGLHLKHEGRAFLRVDHAGKDLAKGQRGTSAKNDDVDVVWQMTRKEGGAYSLIAKKRRMGWVPERVDLTMIESGALAFGLLDDNTYPVGTVDVAKNLDVLGAPLDVTTRVAQKLLADAGKGQRMQMVRAAVKYRKLRSSTYHMAGDKPVDNWDDTAMTTSGKSGSQNPGPTPVESDADPEWDPWVDEQIEALVREAGPNAGPTGTH